MARRKPRRPAEGRGASDGRQSKQPPLFPKLYTAAQAWWAPPAFFLLLSIVYFAEFIFTDHVLLGSDLGNDLHRGEIPFLEKLSLLVPADWSHRMGGMPMSGVRFPHYFPVRLVYLFTGYFRTVGWCYVFSMFTAGWFTYLCIRSIKCHPLAALVGGAAYASSPILLTFTFAGQEAKMLVIAMFPLMLWGLYRGLETRRPIYFLALAGSIGAGVYTPHLQMLYYALWGVGFLFLWMTVSDYVRDRDSRKALVRTGLSAGALALGLGIGAMGLFPQYFYTKTESRRAGDAGSGSGISYAQSWSLHPEEIATLVIPTFIGSDEIQRQYWGRNVLKYNSEYVGLVVLFFMAIALARIRSDRRILPLCVLSLIGLTFALGPHTPVHAFFYDYVPGTKVLRTPGMIAFLFALPFCLMAAIGLHRVIEAGDSAPTASWRKGLCIGSAGAFAILMSVALSPESALNLWTSVFWSDIPAENLQMAKANLPAFGRGAGLAAILVAILFLLAWNRIRRRLGASQFALLLLPLILFDTWRIDRPFLRYEDPDRQTTMEASMPNTLAFLRSQEGQFRVLSQPNLPRDIDAVLIQDEQFAIQRYHDLTNFIQSRNWPDRGLDLLNTRYVILGAPAERPDLSVVTNTDGLVIHENTDALPRFYLASEHRVEESENDLVEALLLPGVDLARTVVLEQTPEGEMIAGEGDPTSDSVVIAEYDEKEGRVVLDIETNGPRFLVACQNFHTNWRAFLNGAPATVYRAQYIWQAVQIPPGRHRLVLSYEDSLAAICRWATALCTLAWAGAIGFLTLRKND